MISATIYLYLIACTTSNNHVDLKKGGRSPKDLPEDSFDFEAPVNQSSEGWELSEVLLCEEPLSEIQYRDASEDFGYIGEIFDGLSTEGGMALRQKDGIWWLWQIVPPMIIQGWSQEGDLREIETSNVPIRLYVMDLDQDGWDDMIIIGEFMQILWSLNTPDEYMEEIFPFRVGFGIRDVGVIDIEGDGDLDLWIFATPNEESGGGAIGWIKENTGPRQYAQERELQPKDYWGAPFDGLVLDWEGDGDSDLYVCNDFGFLYGGNSLLLNDGTGQFSPGDAKGSDIVTACMGASVADMDGDAHLDMYITTTANQHLLKGSSDGFVEVSSAEGLPYVEQNQMLWGAHLIDYNNDGLVDMFTGTSDFSRIDADGNFNAIPFPLWLIEQNENGYSEVGSRFEFPQMSLTRTVLAHDINEH